MLAAASGAAIGCTTPVEPEAPAARVDLRAAMGRPDVTAVGIAVDPDGVRYVFDETDGLYRAADGAFELVMPMAAMPDPGVAVRPPFTDLVAIGRGRFAITALGDGFLLDLGAATLAQHFCYEPGGFPTELTQRTDAVAFDATTDLIHAQPRTFDEAGEVVASQLATYQAANGIAIAWRDVPATFAAGGATFLPAHGLVLGAADRLYTFDDGLVPLDDLTRFGISSIAGLALDPAASQLLVLDAATDTLVALDLATLAR